MVAPVMANLPNSGFSVICAFAVADKPNSKAAIKTKIFSFFIILSPV
jgi:hypothetical protein